MAISQLLLSVVHWVVAVVVNPAVVQAINGILGMVVAVKIAVRDSSMVLHLFLYPNDQVVIVDNLDKIMIMVAMVKKVLIDHKVPTLTLDLPGDDKCATLYASWHFRTG